AGAHPRLGRLLGIRLIREHPNPDLAAALDVTGHRHAGRLDLLAGQPAAAHRLEAVVPKVDLGVALRLPGEAAAVYFAVLDSLGCQHQLYPLPRPPPPPPPPGPRP